jgi:hypothetical protein
MNFAPFCGTFRLSDKAEFSREILFPVISRQIDAKISAGPFSGCRKCGLMELYYRAFARGDCPSREIGTNSLGHFITAVEAGMIS